MRLDALVKGAKPPEVAHQPLSDHLVTCLVYDLPASIQFVMQDTFESWNITPYEAMEIALENLAARECPMMQLGDGFFIIETNDSYDATRLLLKDRVRKLPFQGLPVAMPLSRNTLFMTGSEDDNGLGIMAHLATEKENDARPLCPVPVILRDDEWETWLPPADHPHYEAFHLLELKYLGGEYSDLKPLLEQRNEQTETDVFVASFASFEKEGRVRSFGTWSKGVPTWLPKTDFIAFFSPETEATNIVEWDRVQEVIGDRMIALECYPPRWSVDEDSFPNDDELRGWVPKTAPRTDSRRTGHRVESRSAHVPRGADQPAEYGLALRRSMALHERRATLFRKRCFGCTSRSQPRNSGRSGSCPKIASDVAFLAPRSCTVGSASRHRPRAIPSIARGAESRAPQRATRRFHVPAHTGWRPRHRARRPACAGPRPRPWLGAGRVP